LEETANGTTPAHSAGAPLGGCMARDSDNETRALPQLDVVVIQLRECFSKRGKVAVCLDGQTVHDVILVIVQEESVV